MKQDTIKKQVRRVADVVVHHGVNATMTGHKTFQLSFELKQNDLAALVEFMLKHGYQLDEAISLIGELKKKWVENVRSIVARSGKNYSHENSGTGLVYVIFTVALLAFGALAVSGIMPLWGLSLASLFYLGLIWLIWSPQADALNKIWKQADPPQEKLDRMLEACQESRFTYAYHHKKFIFIALIAASVLFIIAPAGISAVDGIGTLRYHASITAGGQPLEATHSTGDKFVVFDTNKERYLYYDYLPDVYKAKSTDEVAGVLKVTTEKTKVGSYGNVGDAYKYYVTIMLFPFQESLSFYVGIPDCK